MRKKLIIYLLLILGLIIACTKSESIEIEYEVGDVVLIKPDSTKVVIIEYTAWTDRVRYTVEYLDTNRRDIINQTEIITLNN